GGTDHPAPGIASPTRNPMRHLLIPLALGLSACSGEQEEEQDRFVAETCDSKPGPERAKAAAERTRPELEKALAEKGLRFGDPVFLRAFKEERELEMWVRNRETEKYELFRTWKVAGSSGTL